MTNLTMQPGGEVTLPPEVREHYGMTPGIPIRVIETRAGVLLVPLTHAPMSPELAQELAAWQELSQMSWGTFPYEE